MLCIEYVPGDVDMVKTVNGVYEAEKCLPLSKLEDQEEQRNAIASKINEMYQNSEDFLLMDKFLQSIVKIQDTAENQTRLKGKSFVPDISKYEFCFVISSV